MFTKQRTAKLSIKYCCSHLNQSKQKHANNLCPFSVLFWTILSLILLRLVRSQQHPAFGHIPIDIIPKLQTYSIHKRKQLKWVPIPPSEWKQSTRKEMKLDVVAYNTLIHATRLWTKRTRHRRRPHWALAQGLDVVALERRWNLGIRRRRKRTLR